MTKIETLRHQILYYSTLAKNLARHADILEGEAEQKRLLASDIRKGASACEEAVETLQQQLKETMDAIENS